MGKTIILVISLLIAGIGFFLCSYFSLHFEIIKDIDGKYLMIWYNVYQDGEEIRKHKLIKL